MTDTSSNVVILHSRIDCQELARLVRLTFEDMVKYVVDIEQGVIALGGEMHSDAELALLEAGSRQGDLWGANYYPGKGRAECVEFTSLINIRPSQGNRSMKIEDESVRARVQELTFLLVGEGEPIS